MSVTAPPKIKGAATGVAGGYTKLSVIGKGAFGDIYLVRDTKKGGEQLILKQVNTKGLSQSEVRATKQETAVLKHVRHPYIIGYHDTFEEDGVVSIVMEFAAGGDLGRLIAKRMKEGSGGQRFTESEIKRFARQLGTALEYLHGEVHLLHRDIKPKNVFLSSQGEVRLGDFGLSIALSKSDGQATTQVGTPLYMSPELAAGKPYDRSADVWAFGCTLYECMGFNPPWNELCTPDGQIDGGMKRLEAALRNNSLKTETLKKWYSDELCEMINGLLAKKVEKRLPLSKLLAMLSEAPKVPTSWGLSPEAMALLAEENAKRVDAKQDTEEKIEAPLKPGGSSSKAASGARQGVSMRPSAGKATSAGAAAARQKAKAAPVPTVPLWDLPGWNPANGGASEEELELDEEGLDDLSAGIGAMGVEVHAAASVLQRSFKRNTALKKKSVNIQAPGDEPDAPPTSAPAGGGNKPSIKIAWAGKTGAGGGPPSWGKGASAGPPSWGKGTSGGGGSGPAPLPSWGKNIAARTSHDGAPRKAHPEKPALKPSRILRTSPADLEEKKKARAAARPPSPRPASPRSRRTEEARAQKPKRPGLKPTRVRDGFG